MHVANKQLVRNRKYALNAELKGQRWADEHRQFCGNYNQNDG